MNETQKILDLLQHDEEPNRRLAIELMESLQLHTEVNSLVNEHFIPCFPQHNPDSFFQYQGAFEKPATQRLLQALDDVMVKHQFKARLMRNALNITVNMIYEIFPLIALNDQGNFTFEANDHSLWLGFDWLIVMEQQQDLAQKVAEIRREKDDPPFDFITHSLNKHYTMEEEATFAWQDITRKLRGAQLWHYFEFLPQKQCRFYFWVELKGKD